MQTKRTNGPTNSSPAEAVRDAEPSRGRKHPARSAHARLLSVLRGDKYMINAYPPAWRGPAGGGEPHRPNGDIAAEARSGTGEHPAETTHRSVQ